MTLSDLLSQGGGRTFKFDTVGASVTGAVESAEVVQRRNFDTGEPEFWNDGKPVEQVRITLSTSLRDPSDPEDDGTRSVYIKGWGDQLRELRRAIRTAGASDIEPGGTFTATYTRDGELPPGKRGFAPKVYTFEYRKPSGTAGLIDEQAPPPVSQPAAAAQATPTPPSDADPTARLRAAGFTEEQIAAATAAGVSLT